ncbi:MAG: ABC transporter substrate-binding protein [Deltaproteobacteria bacterium]|nr:ABC transporter substrate-binding protein [Deltaproteobacteria bacterium]
MLSRSLMGTTIRSVLFKTIPALIFVGLVAGAGCAPMAKKERVAVLTAEDLRALETFKRAQSLAEKRAYGEALVVYNDYLTRFPSGDVADRALFQAGLVYMAMGDYPRAEKAFRGLLARFRDSALTQKARLNLALAFYKQGDYKKAVKLGESVLKHARTASDRLQLYYLLGAAYSADGQYKKSVRRFMDAYAIAPEGEREQILSTVKQVITSLEASDAEALLETFGDQVPAGYLRLQLARQYAAQDRIEDALAVLSDFTQQCAGHEAMADALELMQELKSRAIVDPFLIGCILPLSGPYATFGDRALSGIELALNDFNSRPEVHPFQVLIRDSKGDANEAVSAVESLVLQDGVIAIIGPMIAAEPAAVRAQALKVPIIALTQKPRITETGDYVFRDFLTAANQVKSVVDYAVGDLGVERFAIFYPDEPYGISFMEKFWDELIKWDAEVTGIESYSPDETDFADPIKKLVGLYYPRPERPAEQGESDEWQIWEKLLRHEQEHAEWFDNVEGAEPTAAASPQQELPGESEPRPVVDFEAVFIPDSVEKVGLIAPQLLFHDIERVVLLGTNLWHSERLVRMAGSYVQGAVLPDGFFLESPSVVVQEFVRDYEAIFDGEPGFLEAQAYDVATILFSAVHDQPEVRSRRSLKEALLGVHDFQGVTGLTSFDDTGDAEKQLYLLTITGRRFVQIRP